MPIARRAEPESDPSTPPVYCSAKCARVLRTRAPPNIGPAPFANIGIVGKWHKCRTSKQCARASFQDDRETAKDRMGHGSIESPPNQIAPTLALRPTSPVGQVLPQRARPRVRLRVPQHLVRASAPPRPRRACIARRNHARCACRSPSGMHPNASQRHSKAPTCVGRRRARRCTWLSRLQRATRRGSTVGCTRTGDGRQTGRRCVWMHTSMRERRGACARGCRRACSHRARARQAGGRASGKRPAVRYQQRGAHARW
jgi:hypothetical protein